MPWDSAPAPDNEKGVCGLCQQLFSCTKGGKGQNTYVSVGSVLVDESPMVICVHCAQATFPKKNAYRIQGIQHPAKPFQIAENGSDYEYGELYQLLLQILCYSKGVLSQDLLAMQHKQQGLIREYLHFFVYNARLVEQVGDSYIGYMYCLVESHLHLLTFKQFYHTPYCKQAQDGDNVDAPKEAEESGGNEAGAGNGSQSDEAGNKSDVTVEVESKPMLKAKGKRKAFELVGAAKGRKDGAKCTKVATSKPSVEVEVKAKLAAKAAVAKTPAKGKAPPKSPSKSSSKKK